MQAAVANLSHTAVVAFAFGAVGFELQLLDLLLVGLNLGEEGFLAFPLGSHGLLLFLEFGDLLIQGFELGGGHTATH